MNLRPRWLLLPAMSLALTAYLCCPAAWLPIRPPIVQETFIPTTDLWRIIHDAGPLMYAILLCSFLLVAVFLERCVSLRRSRVIPKPFVTRFLQQLREGQLDRQEALELVRKQRAAPWLPCLPGPCANGAGRASRSSRA